MSIAAIICEYNPFHNGHKFQIKEAKKDIGASGVVSIMSGNFVQRGAPSLCDKWERTKMALSSGSDLVIELPTVFATQSAERFAFGGVSLANSLNVIDYLYFGSECDDINKLSGCANSLKSDEVKEKTSELLKDGMSYPLARSLAVGKEYSQILSEPNNILAIEYIKAISDLESDVKPVLLKREGTGHHSKDANGNFASASFIRNCIKTGEDYSTVVPKETYDILNNADVLTDYQALDNIITYLLRTIPAEKLREISDMAEGLEHRFIEGAKLYCTFDEISEYVKTKRYTKTRIDRILINILLQIKKEDIGKKPCYIRVLGFNEKGKEILSEIKKKSDLPIITKVKNADLDEDGKKMLEKDIYATDIYSLISKNGESGRDYTISPVVMR